MSRLFVSGVVVAALLAVATPAPAGGVTYDKLAYLTFNAPVQIPGAILRAGTYRFHLTNAETSRNVVQVLSNDGSIVYAMFNTIPDGRATLTPDPFVTFRETPAEVPPALRSLFYGWEYTGYEFVYPDGWPIMIADAAPAPEITYTSERLAPIAEPVFEPAAEPAPVGAEPVAEVAEARPELVAEEIPSTGTLLPLTALGGAVSLLAGLGLGLIRRRVG